MDLKSAVQTVKPIETNVKWWKDNVREKMFSLNILENAVKEPGPIFHKKKTTIFSRKLAQKIRFWNSISNTVCGNGANSPITLKWSLEYLINYLALWWRHTLGRYLWYFLYIFSYVQWKSLQYIDSLKFKRSCNINYCHFRSKISCWENFSFDNLDVTNT